MKTLDTPIIAEFVTKFGLSVTKMADKMQVSKATLSYNLKHSTRQNRYYNNDLNIYLQEMYKELQRLLVETDNQKS